MSTTPPVLGPERSTHLPRRQESPQPYFNRHIRPLPTASYATRLRCLLLFALQMPGLQPNGKGITNLTTNLFDTSSPAKRFIVKKILPADSPLLTTFGLNTSLPEDTPYMVSITIATRKVIIPERSEAWYSIQSTAITWVGTTGDSTTTSDSRPRTVMTMVNNGLEWAASMTDIEMTWDEILTLLQRNGKVSFKGTGEDRADIDRERLERELPGGWLCWGLTSAVTKEEMAAMCRAMRPKDEDLFDQIDSEDNED